LPVIINDELILLNYCYLRLKKNFRAKGMKLYFGFVDFEKAFDGVPREVIR